MKIVVHVFTFLFLLTTQKGVAMFGATVVMQ